MNKASYRELQKFVNEGHQPWRLQSGAVAGEEVLEIEHVPKAQWNVFTVDVKLVSETERSSVYEYKSSRKPRTSYLIVLTHPKWLDKIAKEPKWMIWVPTEVTTTTCRTTSGS